MTNNIKEVLKLLGIFVVVGIVICFLMYLICPRDDDTTLSDSHIIYNDGIHDGCGGHWRLAAASNTVYYIYECDKCYKTLETVELMK